MSLLAPIVAVAFTALVVLGPSVRAQGGPDLFLPEITGMPLSGGGEGPFLIGEDGAGTLAYAAGVTACNIGGQPLSWDGATNQHPVFAQNLYRLKDGRFIQIGLSWVKHGLGAMQGSMCGTCVPVWSGLALGVGCSDIYSAGLHGFQGALGPRSAINPATGAFPMPGPPSFPSLPPVDRRLQVLAADLDPALNAGARYFIETQAVHPDDAQLGNDADNASCREVAVASAGPYFELAFAGPTIAGRPALRAWKDGDPLVCLRDVDVPGDGRLTIGYRAIPLASGRQRHEFALHNFDSDRGAASLTVRFRSAAAITGQGFHDVAHHSGEAQNSLDWAAAILPDAVAWTCVETFAQNPDANALRWGTLSSFWCEAASAPVEVTIGLFKPGVPAAMTVAFPFTLALERTGTGDLSIALGGVPPGTVEGFCFFSLDTALPAGAGPLGGLVPDFLTAAIIAIAPASGPPLHWPWPVAAPVFPAGGFPVPASGLAALAGEDLDGLAIAIASGDGAVTVSPVCRLRL